MEHLHFYAFKYGCWNRVCFICEPNVSVAAIGFLSSQEFSLFQQKLEKKTYSVSSTEPFGCIQISSLLRSIFTIFIIPSVIRRKWSIFQKLFIEGCRPLENIRDNFFWRCKTKEWWRIVLFDNLSKIYPWRYELKLSHVDLSNIADVRQDWIFGNF